MTTLGCQLIFYAELNRSTDLRMEHGYLYQRTIHNSQLTTHYSQLETFHLQGQEYIELNKLLKLLHLVQSGAEANIMIENGEVIVNENVELRKRHKLRDGYVVEFGDRKIMITMLND